MLVNVIENKKRILFIGLDLFLKSGGGLATLAFYEAIKNVYSEEKVDLIFPKEAYAKLDDKTNAFPVPRRNRIFAIIALFFGYLHRFRHYTILHLKKYKNHYSLCIINGGVYAGDMINYIKSLGIKVVVIHHNYEKEYHKDNKSIISFNGRFFYYICRNERNAYLKADLNLFLTQADHDKFEDSYGINNGKNYTIGIFEHSPKNIPLIKKTTRPYKLVITGSMDHNQTEQGIINFYKICYPIIREYFPSIKIIFSGRNPTKIIKSIAEKEKNYIDVIASPENMEEVISLGAIYCCPTNIGGGVKLRIMDGLRQGLPVITHRISSRGYDVFFNKEYFKIYDSSETFKKGLKELLTLYESDKIDNKRIQDDYNEYFSFDAGCERLEKTVFYL
jgi:hypothetical protein